MTRSYPELADIVTISVTAAAAMFASLTTRRCNDAYL